MIFNLKSLHRTVQENDTAPHLGSAAHLPIQTAQEKMVERQAGQMSVQEVKLLYRLLETSETSKQSATLRVSKLEPK